MAIQIKKLILYEYKDPKEEQTSPLYKRPSIIIQTKGRPSQDETIRYVYGVFRKIFKENADLYGECAEGYRLVLNHDKVGSSPSSCFVLDKNPEGHIELRSDSPNKNYSKERLAKMVQKILEEDPDVEVEDKEGYLKN
jgi:hypothetical protein